MKINEKGLAIIKRFEGLGDGNADTPDLEPYMDCVGIPTLGWGSCWGLSGDRVTLDHPPITKDEAEFLLARELRQTENAIARLVRVPITSNQFSAVCSLVYNIGSGNFQRSSVRMQINRGSFVDASNEFWKWRRASGRILKGLVRRREAERRLFVSIDQPIVTGGGPCLS